MKIIIAILFFLFLYLVIELVIIFASDFLSSIKLSFYKIEMNKKNKFILGENLLIIIPIAIILILGIVLFNFNFVGNLDNETRGTFGDLFGFSNAIFSGLAFAGIIITIILQMNELREQREELKLTRNEFKLQNYTLSIQRFENTFFNLLSIHHEIIDNLEFKIKSAVCAKRNCFVYGFTNLFENLVNGYSKNHIENYILNLKIKTNTSIPIKLQIDKIYGSEIYPYVKIGFGHYYRNLYRIFKYIDTKEFITKNQSRPK